MIRPDARYLCIYARGVAAAVSWFSEWQFFVSDMNELVLMAHVLFGVACLITTVWVFVDVLNVSETNLARIRTMSLSLIHI